MDTLYLVFKHQFQIVFGFALQTEKLRLKQTGTLPQYRRSVKRGSLFVRMLFFADKKPVVSNRIQPQISATSRLQLLKKSVVKVDKSRADTATLSFDVIKIPTHLFCLREARFVRPV